MGTTAELWGGGGWLFLPVKDEPWHALGNKKGLNNNKDRELMALFSMWDAHLPMHHSISRTMSTAFCWRSWNQHRNVHFPTVTVLLSQWLYTNLKGFEGFFRFNRWINPFVAEFLQSQKLKYAWNVYYIFKKKNVFSSVIWIWNMNLLKLYHVTFTWEWKRNHASSELCIYT